jgi:hypothetical protein
MWEEVWGRREGADGMGKGGMDHAPPWSSWRRREGSSIGGDEGEIRVLLL